MSLDNWQLASNILLALGITGLVIGLLLRFELGRVIVGLLLVLIAIASLLDGHSDTAGTSSDTPIHKVSRFLLIAGGICLALALFIRYFYLSAG